MRLFDITNIHDIGTEFGMGLIRVGGLVLGSLTSLSVANLVPAEMTVIQGLSTYGGWGLAMASIFTLWKVVIHLFRKLEERDAVIINMHKEIAAAAELRAAQRIAELNQEIAELERQLQK